MSQLFTLCVRGFTARSTAVRWGLVLAAAFPTATAACSSGTDVVAYRTGAPVATADDAGVPDMVSDAGGAEVDAQVTQLTVVGVRAENWPYTFAPWPLSTPLERFFADATGDKDVRVVVENADADTLLRLFEEHDAEEYGPPNGPLGVRDTAGAEFTIRLVP